MTRRVQAHFYRGQSSESVRRTLYGMRIDDVRTSSGDSERFAALAGDIYAMIWPKKFMGVVPGVVDYYFQEFLVFRFGGDDALDNVVFRPDDGWTPEDAGPLQIELTEPAS